MKNRPMSREEIDRQLKAFDELDITDFIRAKPDGSEVIDFSGVVGTDKVSFVRKLEFEDGQLIGLELCNSQSAHRDGIVYLIRAENGLVKIGKTTDVQRRFAALNTGSPIELRLIAHLRTVRFGEVETQLHERFADRRVRGEWFSLSEADIASLLTEWPWIVAEGN